MLKPTSKQHFRPPLFLNISISFRRQGPINYNDAGAMCINQNWKEHSNLYPGSSHMASGWWQIRTHAVCFETKWSSDLWRWALCNFKNSSHRLSRSASVFSSPILLSNLQGRVPDYHHVNFAFVLRSFRKEGGSFRREITFTCTTKNVGNISSKVYFWQ